jgi:AhpD family alkylhydroperoxidase
MLKNWVDFMKDFAKAKSLFNDANPKMALAFKALNEAQVGNGALDAKTCELIALAVAVTTRCDGCIGSHAVAARKAGATEGELSEALGTAIALNAGAAYVYSVRAMEAFGQSKE